MAAVPVVNNLLAQRPFFYDVRLAAHVSKGLKSRIRPVVGRI